MTISMKEPIQKETDNNFTQNIAIAKEYMKKLQSYFEGVSSNKYRLNDQICLNICLKFTEQPQRDNKN